MNEEVMIMKYDFLINYNNIKVSAFLMVSLKIYAPYGIYLYKNAISHTVAF